MEIKTHTNGRKYAHLKGAPGQGRVRISLRTKSAKEAAQLAKTLNLEKLEHAAQAGTLQGEAITRLAHGRRITMRSLLAKWVEAGPLRGEAPSTTDRSRYAIEAWLDATGEINSAPASISPQKLFDYLNGTSARSYATRRRQQAFIRPFLIFVNTTTQALPAAILSIRVSARNLPQAQREPAERRDFTLSEQEAILEHLQAAWMENPQDEQAAFWFFASHLSRAAGLRLGDIASLEWFSLGKPGHIIVWADKRLTRVCLPISERITPGLRKLIPLLPIDATAAEPPRFVFPAMAAKYAEVGQRSWFSVTYGRILAKLGIEGVSFHSWRHTAITRWKATGFSLDECAVYAGHGSTDTTKGYVHE